MTSAGRYVPSVPLSKAEFFSYDDQLVHPCSEPTSYLPSHVVIAVDGACSNNSFDNTRASYAVFVADNNDLNEAALLRSRSTSSRAELVAGLRALTVAQRLDKKIRARGNDLDKFIIKSDSTYLVRGMTEWLPEWHANKWKRSGSQKLVNKDLWIQLRQRMLPLLRKDVEVEFWHVRRSYNKKADKMASNVLRLG